MTPSVLSVIKCRVEAFELHPSIIGGELPVHICVDAVAGSLPSADLTGLARDEIDAYLKHRLRLAGCELPVFEEAAVEALFQATRGLLRPINRIADYALSAATLNKARTVNADHLHHAIDETRP